MYVKKLSQNKLSRLRDGYHMYWVGVHLVQKLNGFEKGPNFKNILPNFSLSIDSRDRLKSVLCTKNSFKCIIKVTLRDFTNHV